MSGYRQGGYYEALAVDQLEAAGFTCWQARGSKGAADIVAMRCHTGDGPGPRVLLVQVKGKNAARDHDCWNRLWALAGELDVTPLWADWPGWKRHDAGDMRLVEIIGPHAPRSQDWPSEPYWPLDGLRPETAR